MKKFFTFLLYVFIILLIAGIVFGVAILLGKPLETAAVVFGLILAIWLLFILVRKLIIRYRARAQVQRVIENENAVVDAELGRSPKQLLKDLKKDWNKAVKTLKGSHLKLKGDPLYVLPWYMVFGKPRSGKSTALRNASLLSPAMELSQHEDGSTLNLEWWLYDQAIVIDTAGRYAVPDVDKRDRKEWTSLLSMLSRHKQKEPLNGLVLVVSAERLLNCSAEELMEEGQQVRSGVNELMERLEAQMPVYLMVTKCDLVDQFSNWCKYLPEDSLEQVMGYLFEEETGDIHTLLDTGFDEVLGRIKELRLLMMERSDNPDDSLIELPISLERLRKGLHAFATTALKDNLYQETPRFRGLYFSSSQQAQKEHGETELKNNGTFLHHLFTKVMPPDRGILSTLPSAERLRRAVRNYGVSISGAVLVVLILAITSAFFNDKSSLDNIVESYSEIDMVHSDINDQIISLNRLYELIEEVKEAESEWVIPWYGPYNQSPQYKALVATYIDVFQKHLLTTVDKPLDLLSVGADSERTAYLVSGIVRRINIMKAVLNDDFGTLNELPDIPDEYLLSVSDLVSVDASQLFNNLFRQYVLLQSSDVEITEEQNALQALLVKTVASNHGSYEWLIEWANIQGFEKVKLSDFWGGSRILTDQPVIDAAYTLEGRTFLNTFLDELTLSSEGSAGLAAIKAEFMQFYNRKYLKTWLEFTEKFDIGKNKLRGRKEWLDALETMTGKDNPYFAYMRRVSRELEPVFADGFFQAREQIDYFADIQNFTGDDSGAVDNSKRNKTLSKMALKVIGKFGGAGKAIAKAGKTGMKTQKKLKGKGGKEVDLDAELEKSAASYKEYKLALQDIAFNADSSKLSYNATVNAFANPDSIASGDDAGAKAWAAVISLQRIIGKPRESNRLFWDLYSGPVRLAYDYMRQEAACHLQTNWEDNVLAGVVGVNEEKLGSTLIGEGGLVWNYVETDAAPFLAKKFRKGYLTNIVNSNSLPWDSEFITFVNNADDGKGIVSGEFTVKISALPTGVNQSATISPYATYLDLHCADEVQTLENYNYSASKDFLWSIEKCGITTLRIEVGEYSLRKTYPGIKGFSQFLAEFRDGRHIFTPDDFPEQASQLKNSSVKAIDVNYKIKGQGPVIKMLTAVPLAPPDKVMACWSK
jgi:type VI secretion system protein ImpL